MKYILSFVLVLICCPGASGQGVEDYSLSSEFKGSVKSIKQISIRYKEGRTDTNKRTKIYDVDGRIIEDAYDYFDDVTHRFVYNEKRVLIEVWKKSEGKERLDQEYKYHKNGRTVEKLRFGSDKILLVKTVCNYNKENMLSEELVTIVFPRKQIRHTYHYNEKGKKIKKISYYSDDTVYTSYKYDVSGKEIQIHQHGSSGAFSKTCDMIYKDGNLGVVEICTGGNGTTKKETKCEHPDVKGNYQTKTYFDNGMVSSVDQYTFEYY